MDASAYSFCMAASLLENSSNTSKELIYMNNSMRIDLWTTWTTGSQGYKSQCCDAVLEPDGASQVRGEVAHQSRYNANKNDRNYETGVAVPHFCNHIPIDTSRTSNN